MNRGVVYALSHPAWVDETLRSAASVRRHMPDLARELYVTENLLDQVRSADAGHFTELMIVGAPTFANRPRFESMLETKLDQAVFLDSDTYFVEPTYELFELLDLFGVAATPAPQYFHPRTIEEGIYERFLPAVSEAIPEWNGGVIVANVTSAYR